MDNLNKYYEKNYAKFGAKFQREYPNEELVRFIARNFFKFKSTQKNKIKILETGCGSGGNLWMLAEQGYKSFGIDLSENSVQIAKSNLKKKKLKSEIIQGNMVNLPYKNNFFDAIVDVFSSCHLTTNQGKDFLNICNKKLKKNGLFFSYFPSKKSKMFRNKKNIFLDKNTIFNNMKIKTVYKINDFPFRFLSKKDYFKILKKNNFEITHAEELTKTYFNGHDYFVFNVIEAKKVAN
jgi:cyclopropane fatty-acyl-phospholipid synthase-like methyltransferase|tara:strand:- start:1132 stop:1839 length:708 start_codon:yes stop_codon:yes gene_type:complete